MAKADASLPDIGYIRLPKVLSVIPVSKSTWWTWVASGRAPQPVKLSPGVTVWRVEDIRQLIKRNETHESPGSR
jgi:prophage regulatory protein